jgi:hypothetical protein
VAEQLGPCVDPAIRSPLDPENAAAEKSSGDFQGAVRRVVVDDTDLDPLAQQMIEASVEKAFLVSNGQ